jgi:hypothetical protein
MLGILVVVEVLVVGLEHEVLQQLEQRLTVPPLTEIVPLTLDLHWLTVLATQRMATLHPRAQLVDLYDRREHGRRRLRLQRLAVGRLLQPAAADQREQLGHERLELLIFRHFC